MTSAIIETGGKQYHVTPGQLLQIEKLEATIGDTITFDRVLLVVDNGNVEVGSPTVNTVVTAEVIDQIKGKKLRVFTYKSKKRQRRTLGHRQLHTTVRIASIGAPKKEVAPKAEKAEATPKKAVAKKPAVKKATAK